MRMTESEVLVMAALGVAAITFYTKKAAKNKKESQRPIAFTDELYHEIFKAREFREIKKYWTSLREQYLTCEHSAFPALFFEHIVKKLLRGNLSWRFYDTNTSEKDTAILSILKNILEYDLRNTLLSAEEKDAIKNSAYLVSSSLLVCLSLSKKITPEIVSELVNYFLTFPAANDKTLLSEEIARQLLQDTRELDSDTVNLTARHIIDDHIRKLAEVPGPRFN